MKIAPIIDALKAAKGRGGALCYRLIVPVAHVEGGICSGDWKLVNNEKPAL